MKKPNSKPQIFQPKTVADIIGKTSATEVYKNKGLLNKVVVHLKETIKSGTFPDAFPDTIEELGKLSFSFEAVIKLPHNETKPAEFHDYKLFYTDKNPLSHSASKSDYLRH